MTLWGYLVYTLLLYTLIHSTFATSELQRLLEYHRGFAVTMNDQDGRIRSVLPMYQCNSLHMVAARCHQILGPGTRSLYPATSQSAIIRAISRRYKSINLMTSVPAAERTDSFTSPLDMLDVASFDGLSTAHTVNYRRRLGLSHSLSSPAVSSHTHKYFGSLSLENAFPQQPRPSAGSTSSQSISLNKSPGSNQVEVEVLVSPGSGADSEFDIESTVDAVRDELRKLNIDDATIETTLEQLRHHVHQKLGVQEELSSDSEHDHSNLDMDQPEEESHSTAGLSHDLDAGGAGGAESSQVKDTPTILHSDMLQGLNATDEDIFATMEKMATHGVNADDPVQEMIINALLELYEKEKHPSSDQEDEEDHEPIEE